MSILPFTLNSAPALPCGNGCGSSPSGALIARSSRLASTCRTILDASMEEYHTLMNECNLECEWQERGLLYVFETERGWKSFSGTDRMLSEHFGVSATFVDGSSLTDFDPGLNAGLAGAFHYPDDTSLNPEKLNRTWVARLKERKVNFLEGRELQEVVRQSDRISHLVVSGETMKAVGFVFALGAWVPAGLIV